jgi:hypothetical protein
MIVPLMLALRSGSLSHQAGERAVSRGDLPVFGIESVTGEGSGEVPGITERQTRDFTIT